MQRLNIESAAITTVSRAAPWLAPIPTAWLVWDRTVKHLHFPAWVGLVAGLTLECLGLAVLVTALELYNYNRSKRQKDPAAPVLLPAVLVVGYFLSAELLTVLLDTAPKLQDATLADWAPAVFPILSVAAMAILALRADHQRRLQAISEDKVKLSEAHRKAAKSEPGAATASEPAATVSPAPSFVCGVCGRSFVNRYALSAHMRAHSS